MSKIKKFKKPTEDDLDEMYIKANRKGSREAELENSTGFTSMHRVHESKKAYRRNPKHKSEFSHWS